MKSITTKFLSSIVGLIMFTLISAATAQAATFTSAATGNWNAPATWTFTGVDADGIPDADDTVTIAAAHTVTVSDSRAAGSIALNGLLVIANGGTLLTNGTSSAGSSLTVQNGGTFSLNTTFTFLGGVTVDTGGTITGTAAHQLAFSGSGTTFTNNGTVTVITLFFRSGGMKNIAGTGSYAGAAQIRILETTTVNVAAGTVLNNVADFSIDNASTLALGSNGLIISGTTINNGGGGSITGTAALTAQNNNTINSGGSVTAPLVVETGTLMTGSITYNGTAAQTVQTANIDYTQLGIDNAAGVTLSSAETVTQQLTLTNGAFNNGAFLTLASGATIERNIGTLAAVPTYAGTINLRYVGGTSVTIANEFPASASVVNLTVNKTAGNSVTLNGARTIAGALTTTSGTLLTGASVLTVGASGTTTGSSSGYVIGNLRKINPAAGFVYIVGTANGYSPMTLVTVTGAGDLTTTAVQAIIPGSIFDPNRVIQRHWSLTNNGLTSARLQFQYLQIDVPNPANEPAYRVFKDTNGAPPFVFPDGAADNVDETANVGTLINPTTAFSNWSIGNPLAPTSAPANLGGRITKADGSPLAGATVALLNLAGNQTVTTTTGNDGRYHFNGIATGRDYIITPTRGGFVFNPSNRHLSHNGERGDLDFTAEAQPARAVYDFDGDGKSDIAVFRPSDATWYILQSSNNTIRAEQFGLATDKLAPADYDGDGVTDLAVYRASEGVWYIRNSATRVMRAENFGAAEDAPVPADYDGDGKADIAVFRLSTGSWYILQSSNNQSRGAQFGQSGDVPMIADFDADGKSDITVFRPSSGTWYWVRSSDNQNRAAQFGQSGDVPLSGDFNGDGRSDLAVFRPSNGFWYVARPTGAATQDFAATQFGMSTDVPVAADYDGDGETDIAVYRASEGNWYVLLPSSGNPKTVTRFGAATDKPIPSAFQP